MTSPSPRTTKDVFEDHLQLGRSGSLEDDIERKYSPDVVTLCRHGIYRGTDGLRQVADRLRQELPGATFDYQTRLAEDDFAFLEWTAHSPGGRVRDGADSFVIREGRIVCQTIHYTIES